MDWTKHPAKLELMENRFKNPPTPVLSDIDNQVGLLFEYFEDRLNNLETVVNLQSDLIKKLQQK